MVENLPPTLPPILTPIRIDREGTWFYGNQPLQHRLGIATLSAHIQSDGGAFWIEQNGRRLSIYVEDLPFVVTGLSRDGDHYLLRLNDGSEETLDTQTLRLRDESSLICSIRGGQGQARFNRATFAVMMQQATCDDAGNWSWGSRPLR